MSTGEGSERVDPLKDLYREVVLKNANDPCGFEVDIDATHRADGHNAVCGDSIYLLFRVVNGVIEEAAFHGASCAICMASASLLCRHLPGQPLEHIVEGRDGYAASIRTGEEEGCPAFLQPMIRVRRYPARVECAMLPWDTAVKAAASPEAS